MADSIKCNKCFPHDDDDLFLDPDWCGSCAIRIYGEKYPGRMSGNSIVDDFIRKTQIDSKNAESFIEWIPYVQLKDVKYLAKGGFATVRSATWTEGVIWRIEMDIEKIDRMTRPEMVVLKIFDNSKNISQEFVKEIETCVRCRWEATYNVTQCYGLTQDPATGNFAMIMKRMKDGDLRTYLSTKFHELDWKRKLEILRDIAEGLQNIHKAGYVHRDFHAGNILLHEVSTCISDLGLSRPANGPGVQENQYGVLPYVAPEILQRDPYKPSSDVYSLGVIMCELASGFPPFSDRKHDNTLLYDICHGFRPYIPPETPKPYRELVKRCLEHDPTKRPEAKEVAVIVRGWYEDVWLTRKDSEIYQTFHEADGLRIARNQYKPPETGKGQTLRCKTGPLSHPQAIYISRLLKSSGFPRVASAEISFSDLVDYPSNLLPTTATVRSELPVSIIRDNQPPPTVYETPEETASESK